MMVTINFIRKKCLKLCKDNLNQQVLFGNGTNYWNAFTTDIFSNWKVYL